MSWQWQQWKHVPTCCKQEYRTCCKQEYRSNTKYSTAANIVPDMHPQQYTPLQTQETYASGTMLELLTTVALLRTDATFGVGEKHAASSTCM